MVKDLGRTRLRLLMLPLVALLLAATAGSAQADYVAFNESLSDGRYLTYEPNELRSVTARFSLFADGTTHVRAGSFFSLQAANNVPGATFGTVRVDVPSPWPGIGAPPTVRPLVSLRAPDALGETHFSLNWTPV